MTFPPVNEPTSDAEQYGDLARLELNARGYKYDPALDRVADLIDAGNRDELERLPPRLSTSRRSTASCAGTTGPASSPTLAAPRPPTDTRRPATMTKTTTPPAPTPDDLRAQAEALDALRERLEQNARAEYERTAAAQRE